jgi:hypothetical protein
VEVCIGQEVTNKGRKVFFFEKKKQKTFGPGLGVATASGTNGQQSSCFFFFRKRRL